MTIAGARERTTTSSQVGPFPKSIRSELIDAAAETSSYYNIQLFYSKSNHWGANMHWLFIILHYVCLNLPSAMKTIWTNRTPSIRSDINRLLARRMADKCKAIRGAFQWRKGFLEHNVNAEAPQQNAEVSKLQLELQDHPYPPRTKLDKQNFRVVSINTRLVHIDIQQNVQSPSTFSEENVINLYHWWYFIQPLSSCLREDTAWFPSFTFVVLEPVVVGLLVSTGSLVKAFY